MSPQRSACWLEGTVETMGFYSRHVFPKLCDCLMGLPALAGLRKEILAGVGGDILEIGFGTGLNLAHYPEHVRGITTVDRRALAGDGRGGMIVGGTGDGDGG